MELRHSDNKNLSSYSTFLFSLWRTVESEGIVRMNGNSCLMISMRKRFNLHLLADGGICYRRCMQAGCSSCCLALFDDVELALRCYSMALVR